jgi:hypothetical protein
MTALRSGSTALLRLTDVVVDCLHVGTTLRVQRGRDCRL